MFYPWPATRWGCYVLIAFRINPLTIEWIDGGGEDWAGVWSVATALASVLGDAWLTASCCVEGSGRYSRRSLVNLDGLLHSFWRGSTRWIPWFNEMLSIIWYTVGNKYRRFQRSFRRWRVSTLFAFVCSQLIKSAVLVHDTGISSLPKRGIEWHRQLLGAYVGLLSLMMTRRGALHHVFDWI